METLNIKTDIEVGRTIFENIPNEVRPGWAGLILSRFDNYIKHIPAEIKELFSVIDNESNWGAAHGQFSKIRQFVLKHKSFKPEAYLMLAENVAKVTYNASGQPAPFDKDSGWWIPSCALQAASHFDDNRLEEEVKSAILIFNRNKKFRDSLNAAKDFLVYKKIDDILWFDWDPIGINDMAPRDEYQSYVPDMLNLKKSGADIETIAQRLHKLETEHMGVNGNIDKCREVANKIFIS